MSTALLIIDVQQALCSGPYEAFNAGQVIERINLVARKARAAGAPVVVIQHESPTGPLAQGTDGWKITSGLDAQPGDISIRTLTNITSFGPRAVAVPASEVEFDA